MLIEFRASNYRSFRDEQTLSLVAGRDKAHPENLIDGGLIPDERMRLLKAVAVYGANASGKSNLISAMNVMRSFVETSATKMNQGHHIPGIVPFRLSSKTAGKPSSFEVVFLIDKTRYEYGFSATAERVHDEWLYTYPPEGRRRRLFERQFDPSSGLTSWSPIADQTKADAAMLREKTRDNGLMLSRAAELNIESYARIYGWFREHLTTADVTSFIYNMAILARRAAADGRLKDRITKVLRHADVGIDELRIANDVVVGAGSGSGSGYSDPTEIIGGFWSGWGEHPLVSRHRVPGSDTLIDFNFIADESAGTQHFLALMMHVLDALDKGSALVVDELERSMHPLLSRKVIELFQSPEANTRGAQIIFTTHDVTLLDPTLFRRDQIWLIEKDAEAASRLFSLGDFDVKNRPRNTEAFRRNYLAGRYGAVPTFGPTFEDREIK